MTFDIMQQVENNAAHIAISQVTEVTRQTA